MYCINIRTQGFTSTGTPDISGVWVQERRNEMHYDSSTESVHLIIFEKSGDELDQNSQSGVSILKLPSLLEFHVLQSATENFLKNTKRIKCIKNKPDTVDFTYLVYYQTKIFSLPPLGRRVGYA